MTFINLDELYVPQTAGGGVIDGDLEVDGDLTVGGNVNCAYETYSASNVNVTLYMGMVFIGFGASVSFSEAWETKTLTTLPERMRPRHTYCAPLMLQGVNYATPAIFQVDTDGTVYLTHKGGEYSSSWGFATLAYPVVQ